MCQWKVDFTHIRDQKEAIWDTFFSRPGITFWVTGWQLNASLWESRNLGWMRYISAHALALEQHLKEHTDTDIIPTASRVGLWQRSKREQLPLTSWLVKKTSSKKLHQKFRAAKSKISAWKMFIRGKVSSKIRFATKLSLNFPLHLN